MYNKYILLIIVFIIFLGVLYVIKENVKERKRANIERSNEAANKERIKDSLRLSEIKSQPFENKKSENHDGKINHVSNSDGSNANNNANSSNSELETNAPNLNSFINQNNANKDAIIDVAVIILDANHKLATALSSDIAHAYTNSGKYGKTGLIKSSFFQRNEFGALSEGDSEIIEKLDLHKYTDYLVLGEFFSTCQKGSLSAGTYICKLNLSINIISANNKGLSTSFNVTANGNGVNESQAIEFAKNNLIDKYSKEYLTL